MPLTKASLSAKIKTQMQAQFGPADDVAVLQKFCDAIAEAVVQEIQTNAVVTGTSVVASGSSSGSWPVTGTVT